VNRRDEDEQHEQACGDDEEAHDAQRIGCL
jgi:hypothetical protein